MISNKTIIVFTLFALARVSAMTIKIPPKVLGTVAQDESTTCFCDCKLKSCNCSCIFYKDNKALYTSQTTMTKEGAVPGGDGGDPELIGKIPF